MDIGCISLHLCHEHCQSYLHLLGEDGASFLGIVLPQLYELLQLLLDGIIVNCGKQCCNDLQFFLGRCLC